MRNPILFTLILFSAGGVENALAAPARGPTVATPRASAATRGLVRPLVAPEPVDEQAPWRAPGRDTVIPSPPRSRPAAAPSGHRRAGAPGAPAARSHPEPVLSPTAGGPSVARPAPARHPAVRKNEGIPAAARTAPTAAGSLRPAIPSRPGRAGTRPRTPPARRAPGALERPAPAARRTVPTGPVLFPPPPHPSRRPRAAAPAPASPLAAEHPAALNPAPSSGNRVASEAASAVDGERLAEPGKTGQEGSPSGAPGTQRTTTGAAPGSSAGAPRVAPAPPPPPLLVSIPRAIVPLGESRVVIVTSPTDMPEVVPSPPELLGVEITPAGQPGAWRLTLKGVAAGVASVRVSAAGQERLLPVQVMKYAGQLVPAQVEVTGQPAPAEFVRRVARAAVPDAVNLEPGAKLSVGTPVATGTPDLPAGQAATLTFPVTLSGPDLLPVQSTATVTVRNRDLDRRDAAVLLYSNDPERVSQPGSLFAAELTPDRPARLLYHHLNAGQDPLWLRVELVNGGDEPVDVQVIEGSAGPTWDAVEAGHRAAARYVRNNLQEIGTVVRVPGHSGQAIVLQRLVSQNTVSGLFGLRSLGGRLFVRVLAEAEGEPAVARRPAEAPAELSGHVYPSPRRPLQARYTVGQNWTFVKLGGDPLVAHDARKKLDGNYGVSYDISLELENPTDQPQTVSLTLSPDAGHARGVFIIDGEVVEADPVTPPVEADLALFRLQPGERRSVHVEAIPVGGSSYPARVVVRPAGPQRAAHAEPEDR